MGAQPMACAFFVEGGNRAARCAPQGAGDLPARHHQEAGVMAPVSPIIFGYAHRAGVRWAIPPISQARRRQRGEGGNVEKATSIVLAAPAYCGESMNILGARLRDGKS